MINKNIYESSDHEGQVVYSAGHYFEIIDGVRHWLTPPPNDYICTNGSKFDIACLPSDTTQDEWFSMSQKKMNGE